MQKNPSQIKGVKGKALFDFEVEDRIGRGELIGSGDPNDMAQTGNWKVTSEGIKIVADGELAIPQITGKTLHSVYVDTDRVYCACKFDATHHIHIEIAPMPNNNLPSLMYVYLIPRAENTPVSDPQNYSTASVGAVTLLTGSSDNIGPVNTDVGLWTGGTHLDTATETYPTAENFLLLATCDGKELELGEGGYFYDVSVLTENKLYQPNLLPTKSTLIKESVQFNLVNGTVEVFVSHDYIKSFGINAYYGMQSNNNNNDARIYISNSHNLSLQTKSDGMTSGDRTAYPWVDFVVIASADDSYGQIMWMDRAYGLGETPETDGADDLVFTANSKTYFRLQANQAATLSTNRQWHGAYSWVSNFSENQTNPEGLMMLNVDLKAGPMLAVAVGPGGSIKIPDKMRDIYKGRKIEEVANSNQLGLKSWNGMVRNSDRSKFSWVNASSCVYNLVQQ